MVPSWVDDGAIEVLLAITDRPSAAGAMCVVAGRHGSGRTALMHRLAESSPMPTVWIEASAHARPEHLESLKDLVASRLFTTVSDEGVAAIRAQLRGDHPDDPLTLAREIWDVLQVHTTVPVRTLCIVDDFDLLDPGSQEVVAYLLRRADQVDLVPVVCTREVPQTGLLRAVPLVELSPLDVDRTRQLIESLQKLPVPHRVAARVQTATGGNPLAISAVVPTLDQHQLTGTALLPHPFALGAATARRLLADEALDAPDLRLLAALAVSSPLTLDQAHAVLGGADLDASVDAGVVAVVPGGVVATHPEQALAAWALGTELEHRSVHRALASNPSSVGRLHLALGGDDLTATEVAGLAAEAYARGHATEATIGLQLLGHALPAGQLSLAAAIFADAYIETVRRIIAASAGRPGCLAEEEIAWLQTQVAVLSGVATDELPRRLADPPADPQALRGWAVSAIGVARAQWHRGDLDGAARTLEQARPGFAAAPADLQALLGVVRAEVGLKRREPWARRGLSDAVRGWLDVKGPGYDISCSIIVYMLLSVGDTSLARSVVNASQPQPTTAGSPTSGCWRAGSTSRWPCAATGRPRGCSCRWTG